MRALFRCQKTFSAEEKILSAIYDLLFFETEQNSEQEINSPNPQGFLFCNIDGHIPEFRKIKKQIPTLPVTIFGTRGNG